MDKNIERILDSQILKILKTDLEDLASLAKLVDLDLVSDFRGADLRNTNLEEMNFRGADLRNTNFQNSSLRGACFDYADLRGANFVGADLTRTSFYKCRRENVRFENGFINKINLSKLVPPHGGKGLVCALLHGSELAAEKDKAAGLKKIQVSARAKGDLIMMGIGGFSPLTGFMTKADWKGVCEKMQMADGTFWPVPITLDISKADADGIKVGEEIALERNGEIMATMKVTEKYEMTDADKRFESEKVFKGKGVDSADDKFWTVAMEDHPGVQMVMAQKEVNIAGPVKVLSEGTYPLEYKGVYLTPAEVRAMFEERGWVNVAALQLRSPMHRSHEFLAKIAIEVCDGILIHSLLGNLKPGDIPANVRVKAIDTLVEYHFVKDNVILAGYPLDMRYAGPREGLLHATFRQNYGVNNMLIGRDHAGVGDFYGLFEAQEIFDIIPQTGDTGKDLQCKPMKVDWSFYCHKCDGMASLRTCPHDKEDRVILSGTKLRKALSEGASVPDHFGREEVLVILRAYYEGLTEKVETRNNVIKFGSWSA